MVFFSDSEGNPEPPGSDWDYHFSEENGITKVHITIYNESLERMERILEGFRMGFTASLPYTDAQVGWIESVSWSVPEDRCTITTRGTADAVTNAVDLFPIGLKVNDLTGKVNDLITAGA